MVGDGNGAAMAIKCVYGSKCWFCLLMESMLSEGQRPFLYVWLISATEFGNLTVSVHRDYKIDSTFE